ncbi:hypothetical protein GMAR_ORF50 [Golden Marseillevirus]|uniref:hypothetical protein n=1 Tax=Golden Marseillevirus TaxID=1720526 RepID=UPI000877AC0C|nr:hypothetical protein GMAR_ORF50 [Golden Marseillevirus]ALX27425.1 hypothetical protein GMAR_ORF50 [Golden Marseillevirus]
MSKILLWHFPGFLPRRKMHPQCQPLQEKQAHPMRVSSAVPEFVSHCPCSMSTKGCFCWSNFPVAEGLKFETSLPRKLVLLLGPCASSLPSVRHSQSQTYRAAVFPAFHCREEQKLPPSREFSLRKAPLLSTFPREQFQTSKHRLFEDRSLPLR